MSDLRKRWVGRLMMVGLAVLSLILCPSSASGANRLYLEAPPGPVAAGQIFYIPVIVDTSGIAIVAAELSVSFSTAGLEVLGLDPAGSVFQTGDCDNPLRCVVDPVAGEASLVVGVPAPGVAGSGLPAGFLILRSKGGSGAYNLPLRFTSPGVAGECHLVANDGLGTDILQQAAGTTVAVGGQVAADSLFAHFVQGAGFHTTITIINPQASQAVYGALAARDADGQPLDFTMGGIARKGYAAVSIGPLQAVQWMTSDSGPMVTGTVDVSTSQPTGGVILFDSPVGTAGVGVSAPATRFIAPVSRSQSAGVNSGLAVMNPSGEARPIGLTLRAPAGATVGQTTFTLPPYGQKVGFLDDFFPGADTSAFSGSITYENIAPVAAMLIRTGADNGGTFATMPVVTAGATGFTFAHFPNGAGIQSTIMLLNPSAAVTVSGAVHIYNQDGSPMTVTINGVTASGSFGFTLPPLGLGLYGTTGSGPLQAGNIRVASDQPVGGTILFSGAAGTDGVGASKPLTRFLAPVEFDSAGIVNTGLSLANPAAGTIQIRLELLGLDGSLLATSPLITIPANGNYVRFIDGIFPGYIFPAGFQGMVKFDSPQAVAAMVIRTGQLTFASLPVIPVE